MSDLTAADKAAQLVMLYIDRKMIAGFHDKDESIRYIDRLAAVFAKYEREK